MSWMVGESPAWRELPITNDDTTVTTNTRRGLLIENPLQTLLFILDPDPRATMISARPQIVDPDSRFGPAVKG